MDKETAMLAWNAFDDYIDVCLGFMKEAYYEGILEKKHSIRELRHTDREEYHRLDGELFWEFLQIKIKNKQ